MLYYSKNKKNYLNMIDNHKEQTKSSLLIANADGEGELIESKTYDMLKVNHGHSQIP